jgi:hypothetical protein
VAQQPKPGLGRLLLDRTQVRHTTLGRTPLDEGSARRRDLYLTTHKNSQETKSMPQVGFEPTIPASALPKAHALERGPLGSTCILSAQCIYTLRVTATINRDYFSKLVGPIRRLDVSHCTISRVARQLGCGRTYVTNAARLPSEQTAYLKQRAERPPDMKQNT